MTFNKTLERPFSTPPCPCLTVFGRVAGSYYGAGIGSIMNMGPFLPSPDPLSHLLVGGEEGNVRCRIEKEGLIYII